MSLLSKHARPFRYLRVAFLALILAPLGSAAAQGESKTPTSPPPDSPSPFKKDSSSPDFGSPESEMHARLILKAEKKEYDENVARAKEASQLATQLEETYEAKKVFGSDDGKKLERLEKLTKRIRNEAGGSDSEPDIKDIPAGMEAVVKRVKELAGDLSKLVESTPRHVISASVIDQANKLLGLIQHVRDRR
jgi:flagellar biosynthesis/type III secretory pathway protein FliH